MNSCYHLCSKQGVTAVYTVTTSSTPAWVFLYDIILTLNLFLNPLIGTPRKMHSLFVVCHSFIGDNWCHIEIQSLHSNNKIIQ